MVQYNGTAYAKRFTINKSWGGMPAIASIEFTELLIVTPRSPISITIGDQTFHGIVKNQKKVTSESAGIDVSTITYQDIRVETGFSHIEASLNIKNDDGVFIHLPPDSDYWYKNIWQVYVDTIDSPGVYAFKKFSDWKPGDKSGDDGQPIALTADKIFDYLEDLLPNITFAFSASAQAVIDVKTPESLDWSEGQSVYNALVEVCEKLRLKYTSSNVSGQLYFEIIDKNQIIDFGDDENVPGKSFGTSDTFAPEEVVVIGDDDLYEIVDIQLVQNWNANYQSYFFHNAHTLGRHIQERIADPSLLQYPPEYMPQNQIDGSPPEESPGITDRWYDPDFGDLPAGNENRLHVRDYILQNVFKNYRLPDVIVVPVGPVAGDFNVQDLLPINESNGLISEREFVDPRSSVVHCKIEKVQLGNRNEPLVLEDLFTTDYKILYKGGTLNKPKKCVVLFNRKIYKIKAGETLLHPDTKKPQYDFFEADTPKLTCVFGVNRYKQVVGSGQIKKFHRIKGLFNMYVDTAQITNGADTFADDIGNLIISQVNVVNAGTIQRIGTTIPIGPGISSFQAQLDGNRGLVQNIRLTDERPGPGIPTSREVEFEEAIKVRENEPEININRQELSKTKRRVGQGAWEGGSSDPSPNSPDPRASAGDT